MCAYAAWALLAHSACNGSLDPTPPRETAGLTTLSDQNPDPKIVEVHLVAGITTIEYFPGKPIEVLAYRDGAVEGAVGQVPGPLLEARKGDRVIVHYRNELTVDTTVHWHGLRLPNASDGTPSSQMPVPPGGTYVYSFVAEDDGTFWYHPHMEADVLIERGLYGAVRIIGDSEPPATADRVFVLDDVKLTGDGELSTDTTPLDVMLGRQGNFLLVNGRMRPSIAARARSRERWRFVNTANGRYFNLTFADRPFLVIAWDGGLLPRPYSTNSLVIAPGERYEVLVTFSQADGDQQFVLRTVHYDRGHNIPDPGPLDLMQVRVEPNLTPDPGPEAPFVWGEWNPIPVAAATPVRKFELKEEESAAFPKFFINDQAFPNHTPISGMENEVAVWEIHNDTEMDHPFHLHGMFFQVLDVNGLPPQHRGVKDTVNVPQKSKLRFAVRYGPHGNWMYHCHILEHAERGMMGELRIGTPMTEPQPPTTHP
jgi:FtsP/CotA-like multicopper oxidase with cupredoxin domain